MICLLTGGSVLSHLLGYRRDRKKTVPDNIEDVLDGDLYRELFDGEHFRGSSQQQKTNELHISLQINTDGVAIFRSSKFSIWPVYAVINELPPHLRFVSFIVYFITD
jgi:hypothetical protein